MGHIVCIHIFLSALAASCSFGREKLAVMGCSINRHMHGPIRSEATSALLKSCHADEEWQGQPEHGNQSVTHRCNRCGRHTIHSDLVCAQLGSSCLRQADDLHWGRMLISLALPQKDRRALAPQAMHMLPTASEVDVPQILRHCSTAPWRVGGELLL